MKHQNLMLYVMAFILLWTAILCYYKVQMKSLDTFGTRTAAHDLTSPLKKKPVW